MQCQESLQTMWSCFTLLVGRWQLETQQLIRCKWFLMRTDLTRLRLSLRILAVTTVALPWLSKTLPTHPSFSLAFMRLERVVRSGSWPKESRLNCQQRKTWWAPSLFKKILSRDEDASTMEEAFKNSQVLLPPIRHLFKELKRITLLHPALPRDHTRTCHLCHKSASQTTSNMLRVSSAVQLTESRFMRPRQDWSSA